MRRAVVEEPVPAARRRKPPVPVLPAPAEMRGWVRALTAAARHFERLAAVSEAVGGDATQREEGVSEVTVT